MWYRLTPRLVLRSSWRPYRLRPGERALVLRTSSVFPPGHPTTRLSLELLQEALTAAPPPPRILDVGCGSGVLLLAAAALGVPLGVGVDLSRRATLISRENARQNGLAAAMHVAQGSTECLRGPFEIILANLPWAVQLDKVAELCRLAEAGGALILSGFRDTQEEKLRTLYQDRGWILTHRLTKDEWAIELPPERSFTWVAWLLRRPCGGS